MISPPASSWVTSVRCTGGNAWAWTRWSTAVLRTACATGSGGTLHSTAVRPVFVTQTLRTEDSSHDATARAGTAQATVNPLDHHPQPRPHSEIGRASSREIVQGPQSD